MYANTHTHIKNYTGKTRASAVAHGGLFVRVGSVRRSVGRLVDRCRGDTETKKIYNLAKFDKTKDDESRCRRLFGCVTD